MDILNLDAVPEQDFLVLGYGGHEIKYRLRIDDFWWMVKLEGNLREKRTLFGQNWPSYDSSCISEWLGSHIYASLGIPVQETMLCSRGGKTVVACRHIHEDGENVVEMRYLFKNWASGGYASPNYKPSDTMIDIFDMFKFLDLDVRLGHVSETLKSRFWEMFVIDSFIGNGDRHMGNWALILGRENKYRLAPVYDNGSSFFSRWREDQFEKHAALSVPEMRSAVYGGHTPYVAWKKRLNATKYINGNPCKDCAEALLRIFPRIDLPQCIILVNELRDSGLVSDSRALFFKKFLQAGYTVGLEPAYRKALQAKSEGRPFPSLEESLPNPVGKSEEVFSQNDDGSPRA